MNIGLAKEKVLELIQKLYSALCKRRTFNVLGRAGMGVLYILPSTNFEWENTCQTMMSKLLERWPMSLCGGDLTCSTTGKRAVSIRYRTRRFYESFRESKNIRSNSIFINE
jgi:hypothetical protein